MSVPIIDIAPLLRNNNSLDARSCSDKIHKLCSEIGFLVITGHGIEKDLDQIFEIAKEFKKLPKFKKEEIKSHQEFYGFGYNRFTEFFDIGLKNETEFPLIEEFELRVRSYQNSALKLTTIILKSLAISLNLQEDFFSACMVKPQCRMRFFYFLSNPPNADGSWPVLQKPHTDFGLLTLLATDGVSGLELKPLGEDWIPLNVPYGKLVVNLGDMLARWTNHQYQSTPHRVVVHPNKERLSIPFFVNPNPRTVIETLPSCITPCNPLRYSPITAGEFLISRLKGDNQLYVNQDEGPKRFSV